MSVGADLREVVCRTEQESLVGESPPPSPTTAPCKKIGFGSEGAEGKFRQKIGASGYMGTAGGGGGDRNQQRIPVEPVFPWWSGARIRSRRGVGGHPNLNPAHPSSIEPCLQYMNPSTPATPEAGSKAQGTAGSHSSSADRGRPSDCDGPK